MSFGSFAGMPPSMASGLGYALQLAELNLRNRYLAAIPGTKEFAAMHPPGASKMAVTIPGLPQKSPAPRGGGAGGGASSAPDPGGGSLTGKPLASEAAYGGKSNMGQPVGKNPGGGTDVVSQDATEKQLQMGVAAELGMPHPEINYTTGTVTSPTGAVTQKNIATGEMEQKGGGGAKKLDSNLVTRAEDEMKKSPSNLAMYGKATGQGLQGAVEQTPEEEMVTENALMNYFGNAAQGVLKVPFGGQ